MKTFSAKPQEVERKWYVIDAADKVLGRVAVEAANILRGKNKTIFTPHVDCGDFVIIVNADKVVLTGNKENAKIYTRFSGYVGGKQVDTPVRFVLAALNFFWNWLLKAWFLTPVWAVSK